MYAVAGIAALAVLAGSLFYYFGRTELPFSPLTSVATVPLEGRQPLGTDIEDGRAYLASYDEGGTLHLTMVDLASGRKQEVRAATEEDWGWYGANPFGLVAYGESDDQRTVHVYDLVTLEEIYTDEIGDDTWHFPVGDLMVRVEPDRDALVWIDVAQGLQVASVDYGSRFFRVGNWSDEETAASLWGHRFQQPYPDNRLVAISDEGTLRVLDAHNGKDLKSTTVEQLGSSDRAMAYQGLFFVAGAVDEGDGYQVNAYDLDKLGEPRQIFRDDRPEVTPERIEPCGAELICLVNSSSELVVVNFKTGKEVWRTTIAKPSEVATILPVGNRIMVNHEQSDTVYSVFFDAAGVLVEKSEGWGAPVDAGSALLFDSDVASVSNASVDVATDVRSIRLVGVGAQSGDKTQIGAFDADPSTCSWDSRYIACAGSAAFLLHRFRQV